MTKKPFPYDEFGEHMSEFGYAMEPVKARCDRIGEWWDGTMRGKYGDVPVQFSISKVKKQSMFHIRILVSSNEQMVGYAILFRHCHSWKLGYVGAWGTWLQGKHEAWGDDRPLTYIQWGRSRR